MRSATLLSGALLVACGCASRTGAPATVAIAESTEHLAFPDVTRLSDGRLLLVYRAGAGHVEDTGRIVYQIGTADGRQWSPPATLFDTPDVDDRDPSVATLADGRVVLSYFQYKRHSQAGGILPLHQIFAGIAENGIAFADFSQVTPGPMSAPQATLRDGQTWIDDEAEIPVAACSSPAVSIDDHLVIASYEGHALNPKRLAGAPRSTIALWVREDNAVWERRSVEIPGSEGLWLQEPSLVVLPSGDLLLHLRTARGDSPSNPGPMAQARYDGEKWTDWRLFPFIGHAPYLHRSPNGTLISAFREINAAYDHVWVSYVFSTDDGSSWSSPVRLEDCGEAEGGYPSIVDLSDEEILIIYYADGGHAIRGVLIPRPGSL